MDRRNTIQRFLDAGILATPELVAQATDANIDSLITSAAQPKPAPSGDIAYTIEPVQTPNKLTVSDFASATQHTFQTLRDLLAKKVPAVSIQHAKPGSEIAVIGRVREHGQKGFVLDDGTGTLSVASPTLPEREDIIGVRGMIREGVLHATDIIYPDIPLNRSRPALHGTITIAAGGTGLAADQLPNPARIHLHQGSEQALLFFIRPFSPADAKTATSWLQRRHIDRPITATTGPKDLFLLEQVPDILWVQTDTAFAHPYKGVLIVSPGTGSATITISTGAVTFKKDS